MFILIMTFGSNKTLMCRQQLVDVNTKERFSSPVRSELSLYAVVGCSCLSIGLSGEVCSTLQILRKLILGTTIEEAGERKCCWAGLI